MHCPGCGAAPTAAMIEAGECGYCGAALPQSDTRKLQQAVEKLADRKPEVVHVTKVEVKGPDVGRVIDSMGARIAGCGTGCVSMLTTLIITLVIAGVTVYQVWQANKRIPDPPGIEQPAHPKPNKKKRHR